MSNLLYAVFLNQNSDWRCKKFWRDYGDFLVTLRT